MSEVLFKPLESELPTFKPGKFFKPYFDRLAELKSYFGKARDVRWPIPEHLAPLLKYWILHARQEAIKLHEMQASRTNNSAVVDFFTGQLDFFTEVLRDPDFLSWAVQQPPRLADVLTIERLEELQQKHFTLPERVYDEKFHILQAPQLFLQDLRYFRDKNEIRGITSAVAFLDIDKFKDFNTKLGNNVVDREVLPEFMRTLERHVYGRGYAYRFGGDEYVVLLVYVVQHAIEDLQALARRIRSLKIPAPDMPITVSVGLALVDSNCTLTDQEVLDKIEEAKNVSKSAGRNRVAIYEDLFKPESIVAHETLS